MAAIIVSLAICVIAHDRISIHSVDIAGHYTLVDYYFSMWGTAAELQRLHWAMSHYPPLSHMVGAFIGRVVNSGFLGMHFASLIYLSICYVVLLHGSAFRDARLRLASWALFAILVSVTWNLRLTIGHEIHNNYFYAQAAGHAVTLIVLLVLSRARRSTIEVVSVPLMVFLAGWIFPLSQIHIAFGAITLWFLHCFPKQGRNRLAARNLLALFAMIALSGCAVRFHPTFRFMKSVADQDGAFQSGLSIDVLLGFSVLLLALSIWLARLSRLKENNPIFLNPLFLPVLGAAASTSLIAQFLYMTVTQSGSDYALRKHTYFVFTVLFLLLSVAAVRLFERRWPERFERWPSHGSICRS